jgi:hypothetical protein
MLLVEWRIHGLLTSLISWLVWAHLLAAVRYRSFRTGTLRVCSLSTPLQIPSSFSSTLEPVHPVIGGG